MKHVNNGGERRMERRKKIGWGEDGSVNEGRGRNTITNFFEPKMGGYNLPSMGVTIYIMFFLLHRNFTNAVEILSKSKLERCQRNSDSDNLNCTKKIVLTMAVPTGSSGREASIVAEIAEVEENSTNKMETLRRPPVVTINKSAAYSIYEINYIRDVPYEPEEFFVKTRKCESNAGPEVVKTCDTLQDEQGHIIQNTKPICCPCGPQRRVPSSCGNFFDKLMKGKANTAHCVRFPGDWYHVFGIGQRSLGFTVRIEVKIGTQTSEVTVGPGNKTVTSGDNFLRVNLVGDFAGYSSIPSFEDFYLVTPRQQSESGQPKSLGMNISMWMLLERVRFTLDGIECNKIGVGYDAFNEQPNFCASPFRSCLHNQLRNFWDSDQNRRSRKQMPLYCIEGRFERINEHPNAGSQSFSIGVTEALNSNLLIELSADDIEYVYQRSPGKIVTVTIPTFEALTQFGVATVTVKNVGDLEASYSLTFDCSKDVTLVEEQFFIMKSKETTTRSFKLFSTTDQASQYACAAILKDSDFNEVDRAECQFTTTATSLDNGSLGTPFLKHKSGFFKSIHELWVKFWDGFFDFITGKSCRNKCLGFFDFSCHVQYLCMSWVMMFCLSMAIFPIVMILVWLLHQKGMFDPIYDWWDDHFLDESYKRERDEVYMKQHTLEMRRLKKRYQHHHNHHHHGRQRQRKTHHGDKHGHGEKEEKYGEYLHHVHKKHNIKRSHVNRHLDDYRGFHSHHHPHHHHHHNNTFTETERPSAF